MLCLSGCFAIYLYVLSGNEASAGAGLGILVVGLFSSVTLSLWTADRSISLAAAGITLVFSVALLTVLLPISGNVYADSFVLFFTVAGIVLLYPRTVEVPSLGKPMLRDSSVVMVFFLPVLLAFAEAFFLGLRFWESYQIGRPALLFIPLMAMWGYLEEALFRGMVQRSLVPLLGGRGSIITAAVLNAAFMLFWGSLMYAIFALLTGLVMGYLYLRSRSLMYVGTIHALQDTWLILAFLALGIVAN